MSAEHISPPDPPVIAYGSSVFLRTSFLAGCCDFITVPVSLDELYFRILKNAVYNGRPLEWGNFKLTCGYIEDNHIRVEINYQQFLILRMLLQNVNKPVSRESFQYLLWGNLKERSRSIDMQISIIRRKLVCFERDVFSIRTIRNFGYMIEDSSCG